MNRYSKDGITIAPILDTRRALQSGAYPVKIRVTYLGERKYYATGKELTKHEWDIIDTSRNREMSHIRKDIENSFELVCAAAEELAYAGDFSFAKLTTRLRHTSTDSINDLFAELIADLNRQGRYGNAMVYHCTLQSIEQYYGTTPISAITPRWLEGFRANLGAKLAPTTIAIRLRTIRSVCNVAIERNLMRPGDYPFGRGKFEIQEGEGRKLALTLDQIGQIARYDDGDPLTHKYRDWWLFLYLCNGINMADFAQLKYKDIVGGEIRFVRQKTARTTRKRKEIVAVVSEPMQKIIERWGNPPSPNAYIFPILKGGEDAEQRTLKTQRATRAINQRMAKVAKALGIEQKVSTYTARHSFATVLKRAGANIAYISESLGHSDLKTTEHYLASFEREEREKNAAILTQF